MGRAVGAVPPRFDSRGQNVTGQETGSATDRERDGSQAKVSRATARMTARADLVPCGKPPAESDRQGIDLFHLYMSANQRCLNGRPGATCGTSRKSSCGLRCGP